MTERRFLYVFENPGHPDRPQFHVQHGEPMLRHIERQYAGTIYKTELTGRWATVPLMEIIAEFRRRQAEGTLPPTNMIPPPKAEGEKAQRKLGHRDKLYSSSAAAVVHPKSSSLPWDR